MVFLEKSKKNLCLIKRNQTCAESHFFKEKSSQVKSPKSQGRTFTLTFLKKQEKVKVMTLTFLKKSKKVKVMTLTFFKGRLENIFRRFF
jgi:hypothetical protein